MPSSVAAYLKQKSNVDWVPFSPAAGWVVCSPWAFFFFFFPHSLRNPSFEQQDIWLSLEEDILACILFCCGRLFLPFQTLCVSIIFFLGLGLLTTPCQGLFSPWAACAHDCTPVPAGSQIPSSQAPPPSPQPGTTGWNGESCHGVPLLRAPGSP